MSNSPPLRTLHGRGAFMSRPKHVWKGYRPPRSARKRWEIEQAALKAQKAAQLVTLPEQPEDPGCGDPTCQAAEGLGFQLLPYQHRLVHQFTNKEESNA